MQTAAKSNLTLMSFSSFIRIAGWIPTIGKPELNQQISQAIIRRIKRRQSLTTLAEKLIVVADQAFAFRQMDAVEQASDILLNLPLPREFKSIAHYYKAFCVKRRGQFDEARARFERVADEATPRFKTRAIIALGSLELTRGDVQSAISLYVEGGRAIMRAREFDPLAAFYTQSSLAILKSFDGDHSGALADLERMLPLARAIGSTYPALYNNYLNSRAVDLLEVGQIAEAQNLSNIVLASPYADAYPEYRETSIDIALRARRASRSVVSLVQLGLNAQNVLRLPSSEYANDSPVGTASGSQKPARILYMQKWKEQMGKEPNGNEKKDEAHEEMTERELIYKIVNLITQPGISEQKRLAMLRSVERIAAMPDEKSNEDLDKD